MSGAPSPAPLAAGTAVQVRTGAPLTHCRTPQYLRGKIFLLGTWKVELRMEYLLLFELKFSLVMIAWKC